MAGHFVTMLLFFFFQQRRQLILEINLELKLGYSFQSLEFELRVVGDDVGSRGFAAFNFCVHV